MQKSGGYLLKRFLTLIDEIFSNDSEFTRMCNLPHNFVTRAKNKGYINPTVETLYLIKDGVEEKANKKINWEWLMEGTGPMFEISTEEKVEKIRSGEKDIREMSIEELIKVHPELRNKLTTLSYQMNFVKDFLNSIMPENN